MKILYFYTIYFLSATLCIPFLSGILSMNLYHKVEPTLFSTILATIGLPIYAYMSWKIINNIFKMDNEQQPKPEVEHE